MPKLANFSSAPPLLSVLLAMLILGVADNLVRLIGAEVGLYQFNLVRSLIAAFGMLAWAKWRGHSLAVISREAVLWRGLLVGAAMYLYFGSLAFLPIGTVIAGLFTAPVFVLLIHALWYRRRIRALQSGAVAAGFAGVLLITLEDGGHLSVWHLAPVLAGLLYALANVVAGERCRNESTLVLSIAVFAVLGLFGAAAQLGIDQLSLAPPSLDNFVLARWQPLHAGTLGWIALHALCASLAIGLLTLAYQRGEAKQIAVYEYSLLIFAGFFAWLFWAELPTARALLGMLLITTSGALAARG